MRFIYTVAALMLFAGPVVAEEISPGSTGAELIFELRDSYQPNHVGSYKESRQIMFSDLDNENGFVRLVYTGHKFRTNGIPNANKVNTEHTWPQSKFKNAGSGRQRMKADLHHLYPTWNRVNGARGAKRFAELNDNRTTGWWKSAQKETSIPNSSIDEYSESTSDGFEPREDHKGNVARSMAYFYAVYGGKNIDFGWFEPQLETLYEWHKADPVDAAEIARTEGISKTQGNKNPFVLDETLFGRAFFPERHLGMAPIDPALVSEQFEVLHQEQR